MSYGEYPGLTEGLAIHKDLDPEDWREAVDSLPEYLREGAERYLSGIVQRDKTLKRFARECGCRNMEEWEELRREAKRHRAPGARAGVRAGRPDVWRRSSEY